MQELALGVLGWPPQELSRVTLRTLLRALDGWQEARGGKQEATHDQAWLDNLKARCGNGS